MNHQNHPAPPAGGKMPPFSPEEMEEMMKKDAAAKEARKVWLSRFTTGQSASPDVTVPYRLYVPEHAPENLPLVVLLHGIGGCGSDNMGQILDNDAAIDWIKAQDSGLLEPCYVLVPQCPLPIPNNRWEIEYLELVARAVDAVSAQYKINTARIYLTGLSLGGYGSWNLNRMYPDKFAAVATCCPACLLGTVENSVIYHQGIAECADALVQKPLWMFHAEDDFAVPVEVTLRMAETLRAAGKSDLKVTVYPADKGYNHGCWVPAYKTPELFSWFMEQSLDSAGSVK